MIKKILIVLLAVGFTTNCAKKKDNDNASNLLLLAALSNNVTVTPEQKKNLGIIRNAVSSAASSAGQAAAGGKVSFKFIDKGGNLKNTKELMANVQKESFHSLYGKEVRPSSLATNNGGLTCTSTSCTGTANGTANCEKGGTAKMTNLVTSYTFNSDFTSYTLTTKGDLTMTSCKSQTPNYFDYPNYLITEASGDVTVDSSSKVTMNSSSISTPTTTTEGGLTVINFASQKQNLTVVETTTSSSQNFKSGTTSLAFTNLKSVLNLTLDSNCSNLKIGNNNDYTSMTYSATCTDTLDGSLVSSGTVGGSAVNSTFTYSKGTEIKYTVSCTYNSTSNNCTVTK